MTDSIDDTKLWSRENDYINTFKVNGVDYNVLFTRTPLKVGGSDISSKGFAIKLSGPDGHAPTGLFNGTAVYTHLIKAVRKLIDTANPDGLIFKGAFPVQDIMYDTFYKSYLKNSFTKIDATQYIRNDLVKKMNPATQYIDPEVAAARERKIAARQKLLAGRPGGI